MKSGFMNYSFFLTCLAGLLATLPAGGQAAEVATCKEDTPGWVSMQTKPITLVGALGNLQLSVRVADEGDELAAGYQWICPDSAEDTAVLFVFPRSFRAAFHMRNVFVPLNITFFDAQGGLVDTLQMSPEPPGGNQAGKYYKANAPFKYALEMPLTAESTSLWADKTLRLQDVPVLP